MDFHKIDKKKLKWILIGITIVMLIFLLYLFPIRIAHWWDETVYLQNAETIFFGAHNYNELSFRPPLISIIFGLGFFIWHSPIFASILTAAIDVLAPIFVFLIGKKIYGSKVGIIAALLIGFSPLIIQNANYLMTDVPVISLIAISFYLALFKERKWMLFASGLFLSLSILMKFSAILLAPILLFYLLVNKTKLTNILFAISGALITILPYLLWAQFSLGNFLAPFINGAAMVSGGSGSALFYLSNFINAFGILSIIGLSLWVIFSISKKKITKTELALLIWAIAFLIYLSWTPHEELRYILPITIPIFILSSEGLVSLYDKIRLNNKKLLAVITIAIYVTLVILHSNAWSNVKIGEPVNWTETDEMKVADYLHGINYTGVIYTNDRYPVLAYYTGLKTIQIYPYTNVIYSEITKVMPYNGMVIGEYSAESPPLSKNPTSTWMNGDKRFTHLKDIGDFYIYNYTVS